MYAVEASSVAESTRELIFANGLSGKIEVVPEKIEDIREERVERNSIDVIVSEPLGTFLFNERMLETYVIARDMFLKEGGKMFPAAANFCIVPF